MQLLALTAVHVSSALSLLPFFLVVTLQQPPPSAPPPGTFDPLIIGATAAITAVVTMLIQDPIRSVLRWIAQRVFRQNSESLVALEKAVVAWKQEGDVLQAKLTIEQARVDRIQGALKSTSGSRKPRSR